MKNYHLTGGIAGKPLGKQSLEGFQEIKTPGEFKVFDQQHCSESCWLGVRETAVDVLLCAKNKVPEYPWCLGAFWDEGPCSSSANAP